MSKEIHELLLEVQKKDRRFRLFQSSAILLVLCLLLIVVVAQFQTLDSVRAQLAEQKRISASSTERAEKERQDIIRRLNCMVAFFSIPDRENLSIYDVERCSVTYDVLPQDFFVSDGSAGASELTHIPENPEAVQPKEDPQQPAQQPTPPATAPPQPERTTIQSIFDVPFNVIKELIGV